MRTVPKLEWLVLWLLVSIIAACIAGIAVLGVLVNDKYTPEHVGPYDFAVSWVALIVTCGAVGWCVWKMAREFTQ